MYVHRDDGYDDSQEMMTKKSKNRASVCSKAITVIIIIIINIKHRKKEGKQHLQFRSDDIAKRKKWNILYELNHSERDMVQVNTSVKIIVSFNE